MQVFESVFRPPPFGSQNAGSGFFFATLELIGSQAVPMI
jgi:hypothetical protein